MRQGFGIAALVIVFFGMIAFFPINLLLSAVAIICAVVAALAGDRIFAVITALAAGGNVFILSPLTVAAMMGEGMRGGTTGILFVVLAFIAAPFIAIWLNASGKVALGEKSTT
jgi:hypothetical protein